MKDLQPSDFYNINDFNKRSENFLNFLNKFIKLKKVNRIYNEFSIEDGIKFADYILDKINLSIDISESDLNKIPATGPFITISNFPLGGLEALILMKIINEKRPNFKIVTSNNFHQIEAISDFTIPVSLDKKSTTSSKINITKNILNYLGDDKSLGFFPAGKTPKYKTSNNKILDGKWDARLVKLIKIAKVPIVPIYFNDSFAKLYYSLGSFHPFLQSFFIQKEMLKKRNSSISVRIGSPISVSEQNKFSTLWQYSSFLRARVYALGAASPLDVNKFFNQKKSFKQKKIEQIAPPAPQDIIIQQINKAKEEYLLHSQSDFDIICAPPEVFPEVLNEIGRLREITFREIGEGTNKSIDIDEYDLYFDQLIIWDNKAEKIVGAYRLGKGEQIIESYGIKGFYISSLFRIKKQMTPILKQSIEMGRSFIVKEYQRKPLSLFLLWKGIFYFILKNPQYRYLHGPVSLSQSFSDLTKNLVVAFFEQNYSNTELSQFVKPRKKYNVKIKAFDKNILLQDIGNNLKKLDKYIKEIEPEGGMPVLFKKYMGMGATTLAFNVDPKFNNCIDGFMILDMFDIPENILKSLAKDLEDNSVLKRFNIENY